MAALTVDIKMPHDEEQLDSVFCVSFAHVINTTLVQKYTVTMKIETLEVKKHVTNVSTILSGM